MKQLQHVNLIQTLIQTNCTKKEDIQWSVNTDWVVNNIKEVLKCF